jgi:predicted transcriptional regulator|tara:strand:- start:3613 stop:3807 length:195 start_codon:yes stop_codon:yes gene_type:complete
MQLKTNKNTIMTIFDHIENIKNQCEFILKELEKEKSIYDYWRNDNIKKDLDNLNNLTIRKDEDV